MADCRVGLVDALGDFADPAGEVLAEADDREDIGLGGADKPLREPVEDGEDDGEMQREVAGGVDCDKGFVQRVAEVGRGELVVRFGEGVLGDDVGCQGHPCSAEGDDLAGVVGADCLAEFVNLSADHRLEVGDFGSREKGADGFSPHPVDVVVDGGKAVAGATKASGKVCGLVATSAPAVERVKVVRVVDM